MSNLRENPEVSQQGFGNTFGGTANTFSYAQPDRSAGRGLSRLQDALGIVNRSFQREQEEQQRKQELEDRAEGYRQAVLAETDDGTIEKVRNGELFPEQSEAFLLAFSSSYNKRITRNYMQQGIQELMESEASNDPTLFEQGIRELEIQAAQSLPGGLESAEALEALSGLRNQALANNRAQYNARLRQERLNQLSDETLQIIDTYNGSNDEEIITQIEQQFQEYKITGSDPREINNVIYETVAQIADYADRPELLDLATNWRSPNAKQLGILEQTRERILSDSNRRLIEQARVDSLVRSETTREVTSQIEDFFLKNPTAIEVPPELLQSSREAGMTLSSVQAVINSSRSFLNPDLARRQQANVQKFTNRIYRQEGIETFEEDINEAILSGEIPAKVGANLVTQQRSILSEAESVSNHIFINNLMTLYAPQSNPLVPGSKTPDYRPKASELAVEYWLNWKQENPDRSMSIQEKRDQADFVKMSMEKFVLNTQQGNQGPLSDTKEGDILSGVTGLPGETKPSTSTEPAESSIEGFSIGDSEVGKQNRERLTDLIRSSLPEITVGPFTINEGGATTDN